MNYLFPLLMSSFGVDISNTRFRDCNGEKLAYDIHKCAIVILNRLSWLLIIVFISMAISVNVTHRLADRQMLPTPESCTNIVGVDALHARGVQ